MSSRHLISEMLLSANESNYKSKIKGAVSLDSGIQQGVRYVLKRVTYCHAAGVRCVHRLCENSKKMALMKIFLPQLIHN